ncbi:MAG: site-specific DNA-methyltransferase, partial [Actinobacteria bacterium]|nr:site-specific DNA-methyltransferase [Actinomycetota bacterium]
MKPMPTNLLYYGDNLEVMRRHVKDESVDLVYLDPPFNSNASYNVLFAEHGEKAASQIKAFEDTWQWDQESARTYFETVSSGGEVGNALQAFYTLLGESNMMAYLAMMAPRLVELRRVLNQTGSLYLHCDPTASHYLKILLDSIFGPAGFINEIVWKRASAHSDVVQGARHYGRIHDTVLFYSKTDQRQWNTIWLPYDQDYVERIYRYVDENGRRYQTQPLHAAKPGGDTLYEWKGQKPQ